jgi:ribosomal protein S18 acetylase RimI-like enzyme
MPKIGPLWHSTDYDFESFERGRHFGIHFGTRQAAEDIGGHYLKKVMLNIDNPIRLPDLGTWGLWNIIRNLPKGILSDQESDEIMNKHARGFEGEGDELLIKTLIEKGYDGFVYENEVEDVGEDSYMVFNGDQVVTIQTIVNETFRFDELMGGIQLLIESIEGRRPIRVDQHGKNIVWERDRYFIVVDDIEDAGYISLWCEGKKVGHLTLKNNAKKIDGGIWKGIYSVEIDKNHRGHKLGVELYRQALRFIGSTYSGLVSYLPDQYNKKQAPSIHRRLGGRIVDGDYSLIPR